MRFASRFLVLVAAACWGVSLSAQGIILGRRPSPSAQPSFHIPGFNSSPISALRVKGAFTSEPVVFLGTHLYTCPMPVAHTNSANDDPMPVARGGTPEPMPVAKSGCWNPLNPSQ